MQEVTVGSNHDDFFKYDTELLHKVNAVVAENSTAVVVYIKNLMKNNLLNKLAPVKVFEGMECAELANELSIVSPYCFQKYKGDAFSNDEFTSFLKESEIDTVELIGVDGGGCVALTAIGACKKGYKVIMNTSAIGTMLESKRDKYYDRLKQLGAEFI